jgi:hypothetical protein
MAAVTPSSVNVENIGSLRLVIAKFAATVDDGDTWDTGTEGKNTDPSGGYYYTGVGSVVGYWANLEDAATDHHNAGCDLTISSGTITFNLGEDNRQPTVYLLVKG